MDRPRLALLNAAVTADATRRNFRRELDADLVEFPVRDGTLPASFDFDGVVITGSRASAYADDPWIEALLDWLADSTERGLPHLGVCFGHQALATALGGTVEPMGDYEIGYRTVRKVGDSRLLAGLPSPFTVFTTHQDAVTRLPPGAHRIAENDFGIHGFEHGAVFAVQFHPEYDRETARRVTNGKDLPDARRERVLAGITPENYAAACEAKRLFDNFVDYVEATARRPDPAVG